MLEKKNYQIILDRKLDEIKNSQKTPSLLLHSCCGPCSSYVLEYLSHYFKITVFYFNPNIYPKEEYYFREKEQEDLIKMMPFDNPVSFIPAPYIPEDYYKAVRGHEQDPERGGRCTICYEQRLEETAKKAKEKGFDFFTTTLSISPYKDAQRLNEIGKRMEEKYGVEYLYSDFKKRQGFKRSIELSNEYDMYRQDYCGCEFSFRNRKKD